MKVDPYRVWVCSSCEKSHDVEPLQCECGGRSFLGATVEPLPKSMGFSVKVDEFETVRRKR